MAEKKATTAKKTTTKKTTKKAEEVKTVAAEEVKEAPAKKTAAKKTTTKKTTAKKADETKAAAPKKTAAKKTTTKKTATKKAAEKKVEEVKPEYTSIQTYEDIINWKKGEAHAMDWLYIEVNAGDLLTEVEAGADNMANTCKAILNCMLEGDMFIVEPAEEDKVNSSLTVRYYCDNLSPERRSYWD